MKHLLLAILTSMVCLGCNARINANVGAELFEYRVKLIDEFMSRFNGEEINPLVDPRSPDSEKSNLCQLFDMDYILKGGPDSEKMALDFVDSVMLNNMKLSFTDPDWYAKIQCKGLLKGKAVSFYLYLTVEPRGRDMYKWVISDVEGKMFNLTPSKESEKIMLSPNENEMHFMHLSDLTSSDADYITLYSTDCGGVDRLTVFNTLVYYGCLKIDYVEDIEYCFMQVPGYCFTVKECERESSNAGWLICGLAEMSAEQKESILRTLYHGETMPPYPAADGEADLTETATLSSDEAIRLAETFVESLNKYISNGTPAAAEVESAVKGKYTFTISDELTRQLAQFYKSDQAPHYRLPEFLSWLGRKDSPIDSIVISDPEIFTDDNIKPEYSGKFTLVKCNLTATGRINVSEPTVFFIFGNQIAGVRSLDHCF